MRNMYVRLTTEEANALIDYALDEVRDSREQARWIIRQELIRLGYLKAEDTPLATLDVMEHNGRHTE